MTADNRIPVTVLTGFLGSGKTTLLNRLLTAQHGKRIAVIENEFGEVGIDHELVVNTDEEIFEMNNGCICCTVRGDLIRILGHLLKRRERFDYILIETTGLANPGPVAQTFVMDAELQEQLRLDGIVTLVDAKHIQQHLDDSDEAQQQVAFADVLLINKTDLVSPAELDELERRLRRMNAQAKLHRTRQAELPLEAVLNIGGFKLERALEIDAQFLEPEYPFEWGGLIPLAAGTYRLALDPGPDPAIQLALVPATSVGEHGLAAAREDAVLCFANREQVRRDPAVLHPGRALYEITLTEQGRQCEIEIAQEGLYGLFTQHHPEEFNLKILSGAGEQESLISKVFKPDHEHDDEVSSVGITLDGDLDFSRLNNWLGQLLAEHGANIFRSKGVLSIKGSRERVVFQGVHMLFDIKPDRPWGRESRRNAMIFIGRDLDRAMLEEGFRSCLV